MQRWQRPAWALAFGTLDLAALLLFASFIEPLLFALTVVPVITAALWCLTVIGAFMGLRGLDPLHMEREGQMQLIARAAVAGTIIANASAGLFMLVTREFALPDGTLLLGMSAIGVTLGAGLGILNVVFAQAVRALRPMPR